MTTPDRIGRHDFPLIAFDTRTSEHVLIRIMPPARYRHPLDRPLIGAIDAFLRAQTPSDVIRAAASLGTLRPEDAGYNAPVSIATVRDLIAEGKLVDDVPASIAVRSIILPWCSMDRYGDLLRRARKDTDLERMLPIPSLAGCGIATEIDEAASIAIESLDAWYAVRNTITTALALAFTIDAVEAAEIGPTRVLERAGFSLVDSQEASMWMRPIADATSDTITYNDSCYMRFTSEAGETYTALACEERPHARPDQARKMLRAITDGLRPSGYMVRDGSVVPACRSIASAIWDEITHLEGSRALICPQCGRAFITTNKRTRFCGNSCRVMHAKSQDTAKR